MRININSDEVVVFTNKLEKMHRSALPNAIRNTLNAVALDVKKRTLLNSAKKEFTDRTNLNFFKGNSKVNFAKGYNVRTMESMVGMMSLKPKGSNDYAVKDMKQQEEGGTIKSRSFIALKAARVGGWKVPKKNYRISDIKKIVNSEDNKKGINKKQRFILSAIHAGVGGYVLGNKDEKFLFQVQKIGRGNKGTFAKLKLLYSFEKKRSVSVESTRFNEKAALKAYKNINDIYIEQAKIQIERLKNK